MTEENSGACGPVPGRARRARRGRVGCLPWAGLGLREGGSASGVLRVSKRLAGRRRPPGRWGIYGNLGRMKIVVCVKHVPDVQSERRLEDGRLVRGEDDVLNELDENAVEAAVSLVEEHGGEVIALTMGPEDAEDGLRRALQMGADSAVLVSDEALAGADVVTTAGVLAAAIARLGDVDLVLTGMASLDAMTSMLPGALAASLGVPALTLAHELEVEGSEVMIARTLGTVTETLAAAMPALVSVTDQANEPRYPNFAAMRAAKKKPLEVWDLAELGVGRREDASSLSHAEARPAREAGMIRTDAGEAGRELAAWLVENKLV